MLSKKSQALLSARSYIDLFAGCGGSTLGLKKAGWSGLFAIEKDKMAYETLEKNFVDEKSPYCHFEKWPEWLPKRNLCIDEILTDKEFRLGLERLKNKVSMVIGGPPCQGFSVGGARRGEDPRNELVFSLLKVAEITKPPLVVIENVLGILQEFEARPRDITGHSVAEIVLQQLDTLGYHSGFMVFKASDFGVPQDRERVIILGISKDLTQIQDVSIPRILSSLSSIVRNEIRTKYDLPLDRAVNVYEAIHDLSSPTEVPSPEFPKFMTSRYLTPKSSYARLMRCGLKTGAIPNSHRFSYHGPKVKQLYVNAHASQKPGRLSKEFLRSQGTKTLKKFLLDPNRPASTMTTHPDEHIHFLYPRNVSLREMARLQSFPDNFNFYGRYTLNGDRRGLDVSRCAQIGNAIPPLLAESIGMILNKLSSILLSGEFNEYYEGLVPSNDGVLRNGRNKSQLALELA
jgi:DNA (cytosine-5)-methyltransferase 1